MAWTDLSDIWCADIVGTDGRVEADGRWLGYFPEDRRLTQDLYFQPNMTVPGGSVIMPSVGVRRGDDDEIVYPNGVPSLWLWMDSVWEGYAGDLVGDRGMWPPSNIGWAPGEPVDWQEESDDRGIYGTTSEGWRRTSFVLNRITGYRFGADQRSFVDASNERNKLWVYAHSRGVVFFSYNYRSKNPARLDCGIMGRTWLPGGGVHRWDFWGGRPRRIEIFFGGLEETLTIGAGGQLIVGPTHSTSRFQVQRRESRITRPGSDPTATLQAALWWQEAALTAGPLLTQLDDDDNTTMRVSFVWEPIGAAGEDRLGVGDGSVS